MQVLRKRNFKLSGIAYRRTAESQRLPSWVVCITNTGWRKLLHEDRCRRRIVPVFCGEPFDWSDKPIFQPLMISFSVIMRKEFSDPVPQGLLTKEDHLPHALFLDGANEPFRVCVAESRRLQIVWG